MGHLTQCWLSTSYYGKIIDCAVSKVPESGGTGCIVYILYVLGQNEIHVKMILT